jgi:Uma2 family endonuclease
MKSEEQQMATITTSNPDATEKPLAVPTDPVWRLSVDQYHTMIDTGVLTDDDPVELLKGWLITKMPKKPPHRLSTQLTREALAVLLPPGWYVDAQEPITTKDSEPEPDVVVVRGDRRHYADRHPGPEDIVLVVEVSDATLKRDQGLKKQLYASAEIPVYWIVNLIENRCEVYTTPSTTAEPPDYRERVDYGSSDAIPVTIDGAEVGQIAVRELLP